MGEHLGGFHTPPRLDPGIGAVSCGKTDNAKGKGDHEAAASVAPDVQRPTEPGVLAADGSTTAKRRCDAAALGFSMAFM